jgi:hypothetical protein
LGKKKKILNRIRIDEISAVDRPAQEDATMTIMKRADETPNPTETMTEEVQKNEEVTEEVVAEVIETEEVEKTEEVMDEAPEADAEVEKAEEAEKTEEAEEKGYEKSLADLTAELQVLQSELALAKSVAELSDAEKEVFASIEGEEARAEFLGKSADERAELIAKAADENAVIYKSLDGVEFTAQDDERLVSLAKQADEYKTQLVAAEEAAIEKSYNERAETQLAHLPGELVTKNAVLRAVDGIEDEVVRKQALSMLKAQSVAIEEQFVTKGVEGEEAEGDLGGLAKMAAAYAEEHEITFSKAYSEVLRTPEGRNLYNQTL